MCACVNVQCFRAHVFLPNKTVGFLEHMDHSNETSNLLLSNEDFYSILSCNLKLIHWETDASQIKQNLIYLKNVIHSFANNQSSGHNDIQRKTALNNIFGLLLNLPPKIAQNSDCSSMLSSEIDSCDQTFWNDVFVILESSVDDLQLKLNNGNVEEIDASLILRVLYFMCNILNLSLNWQNDLKQTFSYMFQFGNLK